MIYINAAGLFWNAFLSFANSTKANAAVRPAR
jgi:hypothetical protein